MISQYLTGLLPQTITIYKGNYSDYPREKENRMEALILYYKATVAVPPFASNFFLDK